jgi:Tol biopolymer transport system component
VTDLDTLARTATQELLERTAPDVRSRYADLRRMRARRRTATLAAVAASVALAVGGWQLVGQRDRTVEPAPKPGELGNGTLMGLSAHIEDAGTAWQVLDGVRPAHLPDHPTRSSIYQFTSSGTELVYADRGGRITALRLDTGDERTLGDCLDELCAAALSPDGRTIGSTDGEQVRIQSVASGLVTTIPAPGAGLAGTPAWSPDGAALAFAGADGLYVVTLASGEVRLVAPNAAPARATGPVSWSPTGRTIAYLVGEPRPLRGTAATAYTATAIDLTTGVATPLLEAGHCFCAGLPAPSLTWSPDGSVVAVATTTSSQLEWGVYLVRPDGSASERVKIGAYAALAWQPLTG